MPYRDEFHAPGREQELDLPREASPPRENYAPRGSETAPSPESYAPQSEEHPRPATPDGIPGRSGRKRSWLWLLTATVVVTAAMGEDYEKPLPPPTAFATPCDPLPAETPTPEPPTPAVSDGELLLGTWSNGEVLVHFDENGGWWKKGDDFALMDWDGECHFEANTAFKTTVDSESGPYTVSRTRMCRDEIRIDRSEEDVRLVMDAPFVTESREYTPAEEGTYDYPALSALYGKNPREIAESGEWVVAAGEELQDRIDRALADKNPFNRQLIWVSALRLDGETAYLTLSDVYGGSREFTMGYRQKENDPNCLLLEAGDTVSYHITDPRGGGYSQTIPNYWKTIPCNVGYTAEGAVLYVSNPYWSWLYQDECCILAMGE